MNKTKVSFYVFGDSHARFNMTNFSKDHYNFSVNSITMFRAGRDNELLGFSKDMISFDNTFIFFYGEIDARAHVHRQIMAGRVLEDIVEELTSNFMRTIKNNITSYKKIIIGSITPSLRRSDYEDTWGPITHEWPMIGTDIERVLYTKLLNASLKKKSNDLGFIFLDVFNDYSREDGTLQFEKSDGICHIKDNSLLLEKLDSLL